MYGTALLLLLATGLPAQQSSPGLAAPADSAAQAPAVQDSKLTATETVLVTAPGEFRAEQTLDEKLLTIEAPGTSPIKALSALPSVNVQTADPFGSYEWAVRISVRGFNQNQLGFTLDDIPLGDMSYGNWNGLHISRAITDENVGRVVMSQGTGGLETASTSNLGGTIQFYSLDPADKRGFSVNQAFGSFGAARTLARFESGMLPGNTKFYLSGAYQLNDKWRGHGDIGQNYWQLNGKLVHFVGSKGELSLFADVSDRREVDYQDVNKVWVQKLGYNWDNYGVWSDSIQAAWACDGVGNYPGQVATLTADEDPCDAGYYAGAGLRKDVLTGLSYKQALNDHWTLKATAYGHANIGRGLWFTPYLPTYVDIQNPSPSTIVSPISLRTSEYGIQRGGILSSLSYETGRNKVEGGVWFEKENWDLARRFYGTTATSPVHSVYDFPSKPFLTQWEYTFDSYLYHFHLQDVYKVNTKLSVAAGFKTMEMTTDGELTNGFKNSWYYQAKVAPVSGDAQGKLTSGKPFLPQAGFNYKLDKRNEVFGDFSYNVRSYVPGGKGFGNSPWGTTQSGFDALKKTLKPETSWTEEAGYRYTSAKVAAQASFFHVNFNDRLLAFANGSGIQGNPATLNNVPGATTNGIDGSVSIHVTPEITFYNAATWNRSTYDGDPKDAAGNCIAGVCGLIKGKLAVDTPEGMYKTSVDYNKHGLFGHVGADYQSVRYFTYSNDGSVGGRFLTEFGGGYGREEIGALKELKLQLNVTNLTNSQYYSSVGTNGFSVSDPLSVNNNTLQVGSPRAIQGTLSARF